MIRRIIPIWGIFIVLAIGCSGKQDDIANPAGKDTAGNQIVFLLSTDESRIDSAQVFFFRQFRETDSLVHREVIYDIGYPARSFDFNLPVGDCTMVVFGNVAADRVIIGPSGSRDSIRLDYSGGIEPPAIYYGMNYLSFGADTLKQSGLILLTSMVELTIRSIPAGVDRIIVDLQNTATGVDMKGNYTDQQMFPSLSEAIHDVRADSAYVISISCFPNVKKYGESTLIIRAYDSQGGQLYEGGSAPFLPLPGKRMIVGCTFELLPSSAVRLLSGQEYLPAGKRFKLEWDYNEKTR